MRMKMKVTKKDYKTILAGLRPGVLETLKGISEWVDNALLLNHSRKLVFRERKMQLESGLDHALNTEIVIDDLKGVADVEASLKGDWLVFVDMRDGSLSLNYEAFTAFRNALQTTLKNQPFGYENHLRPMVIIKEVKISKEGKKVFIKVNDEKPIYIATSESKQGKLLLLLSDPIGAPRSLESIAGTLADKEYPTENVIENTVREIRRKLKESGNSKALTFSFKEKTLCLNLG